VIAGASFRASSGEIPALRKSPGEFGGAPIPPGLLKHADEQTVVGLVAVLRAVVEGGLDPSGFGAWAVLAAPRYFGRAAFLRAFPQYRDEGAWGVSPHLIPAHSLHSLSGTISQVLKAHGTNLGVGGAPGGEREALLLAATLLGEGATPAAWVVLTGRPPGLDRPDDEAGPGDYQALAVALACPSAGRQGLRLQIGPDSVALIGGLAGDREAVSAWLAPGSTRLDPGHDLRLAGPRPHSRPSPSPSPSRAGTAGETRGQS